MSRLKNLLHGFRANPCNTQQIPVQPCKPVAQHLHTVQQASRDEAIPGEIQTLIAKVMQLQDCPEYDRQAFAADWRQDPEGIERGLKHLADYYGRGQ